MLSRQTFVLFLLCLFFAHGALADGAFVKTAALPDVEQPVEQAPAQAASQDSDSPDKAEAAATAPSLEIAPALNNAPPADIWERVRNGFALPEVNSLLVREQEAWFANRPEYLQRTVERSRRYMFYIVEEVEKRGMPTEIALLPFIESAYNPKALSPAHASGIWQFIPSTGKNYGLEQNWWYDGRRDVLAATDAALDYLQKLHDQFGDWELALAAYNYGENGIERAIAHNQAKGEPADYPSLRLPAETRHYVPKLIALRNIVSNPGAFGLALADIPNKPYFTTITLNQHIDIKLAAKLAEIPLNEFTALNPAFNRPVVSATSPRTLLLPVDKVDEFNANLENNSKPLVSWQSYAAKKGESLSAIARHFGTSVPHLKSNNHILLKRNRLASNQLLLVPLREGGKATIALLPATMTPDSIPSGPAEQATYTVKKSDTVLSIAKHFHMKPQQLKALNGLKSNRLAAGRRLRIRTEKIAVRDSAKTARRTTRIAARPAGKRKLYTVRRGDTIASIAHRFKVASNDIQRWNNLNSHHLMPGTKVRIVAVED